MLRRPGETVSAPYPLGRLNDAGLLKSTEDLRDKAWGNALEFSEISAARRPLSGPGKQEQAVYAIFNARREMSHNMDYISPSLKWQALDPQLSQTT